MISISSNDLDDEYSSLSHLIHHDKDEDLMKVLSDNPWLLESRTSLKRQSLLHLAVSHGSLAIVRQLVIHYKEMRSFLEARNVWEETVLHLVAASGELVMLSVLLPGEVNQTLLDQWGRSAVDVALEMGHTHLIGDDLLSTRYASKPLTQAQSITTNNSNSNSYGSGGSSSSVMTNNPTPDTTVESNNNNDIKRINLTAELNTKLQEKLANKCKSPAIIKIRTMFEDRIETLHALSSQSLTPPGAPPAAPVAIVVGDNNQPVQQVQQMVNLSTAPPAISTNVTRTTTITSKPALSKFVEFPGDREQLAIWLKSPNDMPYNINGKDMFGLTALHKFAAWDKVDLLDLLLACPEIQLNLIAPNVGTALHSAVEMGAEGAVRRLLQEPSLDCNALDSKQRTALDLAKEKGWTSIINLLSS
eukprot:scaffold954_cov173-Ochromonas_danica.AAC.23